MFVGQMGPGDPGGLGPGMGGMAGMAGHKPARSPKSPPGDIDWQKLHHQFFDEKNMDSELGELTRRYYSTCF